MDLCAKKGHDFRPFDCRLLYCGRCGEFRAAPTTPIYPVYPMWPPYIVPWQPPYYPYVYSTSVTNGTGLVVDNVTYDDSTNVSFTGQVS